MMRFAPAQLLALAAIITSTIGCKTSAPERKLSDAKPMPAKPLPAWVKGSSKTGSDQQIFITTKLIEITRPSGSADIPTGRYQRKLTDPQFQVFIRGLAQKEGADLMSAPSIVTRDGQKAVVEVIREFVYPVAPGEDAKKEVENTGVTSHIDARHGGGKSISLKTFTRVSEFEGFSQVTPEFDLPVFKRRDVEASGQMTSGHTIVVGGIVDEVSQDIVDTGPLGLMRKRTTETFSRELIIAVTATLIKPDGTSVAAR